MRRGVIVSGLLSVAVLSCGRGGSGGPGPDYPRLENQAPEVAYVGEARCSKCHQEIAATYAHTGMGRSAYRMTPDVAVEDFRENNRFVDERTGVHYQMTERDGSFWMKQYLLDGAGGESYVDERRIDWVIGSNRHSRSYVTLQDGAWYQLPVCWYPEPAIWDYCPGFAKNNTGFRRKITTSCVFCHNGRMPVEPGESNRYRDPVPEGIGCERCHGPGALHVAKWERGDLAPTGAADSTIFNPRRIPAPQRSEVCYQCHLGDSKATERANRWDRPREDYRPGRPINEAFVAVTYRDPVAHAFGLSGQADRLMLSRCFRESGGALDCMTCHNPHVTVYRDDRPADFFNARCGSCHATEACTAPAGARAATEPPDDCTGCHMRKAEAHDQAHASFTDHWIRRSIVTDPAERREVLHVVPAVPAQFGTLDPGQRAYAMGRGIFGLATDWPDGPQRDALMATSESSLRAALDRGFDHPERSVVLGKVLENQGRPGEAATAFAAAAEADPSSAEAALRLGRALVAAGRAAEAAGHFRQAVERHPEDPALLEELAVVELSSDHVEQALALLERALAKDPARPRALGNRGIALWKLRRYPEALDSMRRAAALDPMDLVVWRYLAGSLRQAGFAAEAADAVDRARLLQERSLTVSRGQEMGDE